MLYALIPVLATAFSLSGAPHSASTTLRAGPLQLSATSRRDALQAATFAAAATLFTSAPAFARDPLEDASKYSKSENVNSQGDAALYTPKAVVEAGGVKSTRLVMKMPDPGPLKTGDYIDTMWFETKQGSVLAAGSILV